SFASVALAQAASCATASFRSDGTLFSCCCDVTAEVFIMNPVTKIKNSKVMSLFMGPWDLYSKLLREDTTRSSAKRLLKQVRGANAGWDLSAVQPEIALRANYYAGLRKVSIGKTAQYRQDLHFRIHLWAAWFFLLHRIYLATNKSAIAG